MKTVLNTKMRNFYYFGFLNPPPAAKIKVPETLTFQGFPGLLF
jgi:hypothetical protein